VSRHQQTEHSIKGSLWVILVDQETLVDQHHHQHSTITSTTPPPVQQHHQHRSHTSLWAIIANSTQNSPCSWAEHQGNYHHQTKQAAKASKHGHIIKIKEQQEAGQAPRRCRAVKEGSQAQGGAGQATWGGAEEVPGALDQAQARASPTSQLATPRSQQRIKVYL
jgi:hypothetical protein